ncbi:unnamed protein product, partial [Rotaria magnacalcarata]
MYVGVDLSHGAPGS